jgi:ribosomal protein S18 acetylase RimI-like enzyme
MKMLVRKAGSADLSFIADQMMKNSDELGFIPLPRIASIVGQVEQDGRRRWVTERVYVVEDSKELTGFCFGSVSPKAGGKIWQICVREDARRFRRALAMEAAIREECESKGIKKMSCRVATDIEAMEFWRGAGYKIQRIETSTFMNRRKSYKQRPLAVFDLELKPGKLTAPGYLPLELTEIGVTEKC